MHSFLFIVLTLPLVSASRASALSPLITAAPESSDGLPTAFVTDIHSAPDPTRTVASMTVGNFQDELPTISFNRKTQPTLRVQPSAGIESASVGGCGSCGEGDGGGAAGGLMFTGSRGFASPLAGPRLGVSWSWATLRRKCAVDIYIVAAARRTVCYVGGLSRAWGAPDGWTPLWRPHTDHWSRQKATSKP